MSLFERNRFAGLLAMVLVWCFMLLLVEFGGRAWLWAASGDPAALAYGWTSKRLEFSSLGAVRFVDPARGDGGGGGGRREYPMTEYERFGFCDGMHQTRMGHEVTAQVLHDTEVMAALRSQADASGRPVSIWAFGGSTTAGYHCSNDAGSWPEELERIDPRAYAVANHAQKGWSSDDSIDRIRELLEGGETPPDVVLWANYPNEIDVLYFIMDRNIERLAAEFPEIDRPEILTHISDRNAYRHLMARWSATLAKYSALYRMSRDMYRIKVLGVDVNKEMPSDMSSLFADQGVGFTARNHIMNLEELLDLSGKYGFRIIVVRPPRNDSSRQEGEMPFNLAWRNGFNARTFRFYEEHGIPCVFLKEEMLRRGLLTK